MFSNDYLKILEISYQLKNNFKEKEAQLTPEHLKKFHEIFKTLAKPHRSDLIGEKIFKELEIIIQNCDTASPTNRAKLLHLSHIILNNFSSKSIFWILAIYKRVFNASPSIKVLNSREDYHEIVQKLITPDKDVSRFTCLDLMKKASQTDSLSSQYKYAQVLVRLLSHHLSQD